jgi:RNA polymerase sigma factor (sigma-70 family)
MNVTDLGQSQWRDRCQAAVDGVSGQYDWRFPPVDELLGPLLQQPQPTLTDALLRQKIVALYSECLYHACVQNEDDERQALAFTELHTYLLRTAYRWLPERAEETAQQALELVFVQLGRCRHPNRFLYFAKMKLLQARKQLLREDAVQVTVLGDTTEEIASGKHADARIDEEGWQVLLAAIRRLPNLNQQEVILLTYIEELTDAEIGERLQISMQNARVLRHRALRRLSEDPEIGRYFGND